MAKMMQLASKIGKILSTHDEGKVDELLNLRSSSSHTDFVLSFYKGLLPVLGTSSSESVMGLVSAFCNFTESKDFLEDFLRLLVIASNSNSTSARCRASHIMSEIILQLRDDVTVRDEVWDDVIRAMKTQVQDKVPTIRNHAIMALSRFVDDSDSIDIQDLLLEALASEKNELVRETLVLSLPPSAATSTPIINCTLDVSESVRKATYIVLANGFPIQNLSIKLRIVCLERGLSDYSPAVTKECIKLLKDEWLIKCCNSDPVELLRLLDVQTYEAVGISVIQALLRAKSVIKIHEDTRILDLTSHDSIGTRALIVLEPEVALYWRVVCSYLHTNAQAKDGATTSAKLLQKVLPTTVAAYAEAVNAHIAAGPDYRFSARQLLLIGVMLEYDATDKKVASILVQGLLHKPLDCEEDDSGNKVVMGDGINLGGNKDWASAVYTLTTRVHGGAGECEVVILRVIKQLAQPCRERETSADFMHWLHCLAVTALLLENVKSLGQLQGTGDELLHSLLLPGARHQNHYVQRAAVRCLGLYGSLEGDPNQQQLGFSITRMNAALANKSLLDNVMENLHEEMDKADEEDPPCDQTADSASVEDVVTEDVVTVEVVDSASAEDVVTVEAADSAPVVGQRERETGSEGVDVATPAQQQPGEEEGSVSADERIVFIEGVKMRRARIPWKAVEVETLKKGVEQFGTGNWRCIINRYHQVFRCRTHVDLKDKWRNLTLTAKKAQANKRKMGINQNSSSLPS